MNKPMLAALEYALNLRYETDAHDAMQFLEMWMHGDFPEIRESYPHAPNSVFIGADPSFVGESDE